MKENNFNTNMTDADFDARCRAMLESSQVTAPEPRADLFADAAPKGAGMRWVKWGTAAIFLAGSTLWLASSNTEGEPDHSSLEKVEEVSTKAQEPEVAQAAAEAASAQNAIGAAASAGSEATEAAEVLAHPSPASIEGSETSSISNAAVVSEVPAKDVGSAEASLLEAAPKSGTSDPASTDAVQVVETPTVSLEINMNDEVHIDATEALPSEGLTPASEGGVEAEVVPEETSKSSPKLKLPLTLPSGGGKR